MTSDRLLNIREAAEYLGIGERAIKEMVDSGTLPAYRIGGAFLRFKKSQLAIIKTEKRGKKRESSKVIAPPSGSDDIDSVKDFIYYNDFYILSAVVIVIAVVLMVAT
jgi:excisionase family DNA binding protein